MRDQVGKSYRLLACLDILTVYVSTIVMEQSHVSSGCAVPSSGPMHLALQTVNPWGGQISCLFILVWRGTWECNHQARGYFGAIRGS